MKKLILILSAVTSLLVAGCNEGGTSDQNNTNTGGGNSQNAGTNSKSL
jgi:hypothetical protein